MEELSRAPPMTEAGKEEEENWAADERWVWAIASVGQLVWGISSYRRGYTGESPHLMMPLKAFAVASLFLGAGASAAIGSLRASGIRTVEDMKDLGRVRRRRRTDS
ncbi:hypothetical protein M569_04109 [Genlisea aurea]|uniref:Uncharacterized protein n=1 Tax=Genlisea aurea TaxID=192259 RepID=S8EDM0_9LAMI|nr:hypothetical protein M569_04109 [Genlisea aurea]